MLTSAASTVFKFIVLNEKGPLPMSNYKLDTAYMSRLGLDAIAFARTVLGFFSLTKR